MTSTTARLLAARPWLAPALGVLVAVSGGLAWWLFRPRVKEPPAVANFTVVPGLRNVRVSFSTPTPVQVSVDVSPSSDKVRLPSPAGPATEHQLDISGLAEATDHKLTVLFEGGRRTTVPFRTQTLLIERLKKEASLSELKLSWNTTLPVRSSLVYAAAGEAPAHLDVPEKPGLVHTAQIPKLSPDKDYEITIISHTETREVQHSAPFRVKLFTSAANDTLGEIERLGIPRRILDILWEYRHKHPDEERLRVLLREKVDPLRPPLKLVRAISREFFSSPSVFTKSKLRVYSALKMIEHLERLAVVRKLPLVEVLGSFDWGIYGQRKTSFGDPKLPLPMPQAHPSVPGWVTPPYFLDSGLLPGIRVDQQRTSHAGPQFLIEWRERETEKDAIEVFARGKRDGSREHVYNFALSDPATIASAELWVCFSDVSPLQFFEAEINGSAPLVVRPPLSTARFGWYTEAVGVDPALLVPGQNVIKLRLKPIPEMLEGRRVNVWFLELRTRPKP